MPTSPGFFRPRGTPTRATLTRQADERRGSARERGYSGAWDKARRAYLAAHPLCAYCELEGRIEPAVLVDHLYPHRRFEGVFWSSQWWVASCKACHDGMKQRIEAQGRAGLDDLARRLGRPVRPHDACGA